MFYFSTGKYKILTNVLFLFLFNRQYRLERELKSLLWKVDYNEVCFEKKRNSMTSLGSNLVRDKPISQLSND